MDNLHSRIEKGFNSWIQTIRFFSEDIGMEFCIEKCAMLVIVKLVGIIIKSLREGESFKYLGILEADRIL